MRAEERGDASRLIRARRSLNGLLSHRAALLFAVRPNLLADADYRRTARDTVVPGAESSARACRRVVTL